MIRALLRGLRKLHEDSMQAEYDEICRIVDSRSRRCKPDMSDINTVLYAQQIDRLAWNEDINALRTMILDLKERVATLEAGGANR